MDKKKNNVIDIKTKAKPVRVRGQSEILEERRRKRKEKISEVKKKIGR
jgi:hypothetical protein